MHFICAAVALWSTLQAIESIVSRRGIAVVNIEAAVAAISLGAGLILGGGN